MLDLLTFLTLALCAAGLGTAMLSALRLPRDAPWEFGALSCAAGLGLFAVLLGILGLAGVLGWVRWLMPMGAVLSTAWFVHLWRVGERPRWQRPTAAVLVAALVLAVVCLGAFPPVTDSDSLAYTIPTAELLAHEGIWRFWPHIARSVYPLSQQFLDAALLISGSQRLGLISAAEFVLTAVLVGILARRVVARPGAGWVAGIIALGCPAAAFLAGAAKEDLLLTTMTAAGAVALTLRPGVSSVALAGLFAGLAAGAKYTGLPIAIAIVACVPFGCGRDRRAWNLATAALLALAAGGLWYGVNAVRFGNPLVPAFPSIGTFPVTPEVARAWLGGYGYGRSATDFVLAPFRMALEVATFDAGLFGGRSNWINPLAWLGVPWALWAWRRRPHFVPLVAVAFALYPTWFSGSQVARLLLPAMVLLAVPAADAVLTAWDRVRLLRVPLGLILGVSASLVIVVATVRFTRYVANPQAFIAMGTEHFDAVQWMNTHLDPARDRVGTHLRAPAGLKIRWMILAPDYQVEIPSVDLDDPVRFRAALRRQGFTHVYGRPQDFAEYSEWLVPIYVNEASVEGTRFFRAPPTAPVAVFALQ